MLRYHSAFPEADASAEAIWDLAASKSISPGKTPALRARSGRFGRGRKK